MDAFGIGTAIEGMARVYFQTSRQSGRTISMIESVRSGDRIVFSNKREADRVERMLKERNLKVKCIVHSPDRAYEFCERGISEGRTVFDHGWVEAFYLKALERCQKDIDTLQRQSSGFGTAHFETRLKAKELDLWRF